MTTEFPRYREWTVWVRGGLYDYPSFTVWGCTEHEAISEAMKHEDYSRIRVTEYDPNERDFGEVVQWKA